VKTRNGIKEIPWPADPATLPRDAFDQIKVGVFVVYENHDGTWSYGGAEDGTGYGFYDTAYDAVNDGALCDDYMGE